MDSNRSRMALIVGGGLILFGLLSLAGEFLGWGDLGGLWPLIIIGVGAAFFVGMLLGGKSVAGLAIPGSIMIGVGLIMLVQNWLGWWETWSYAWALIISFVGLGIVIESYWSESPERRKRGWEAVRSGLLLFLIFGAIFEFIFSATGVSGRGGQALWAVVLVIVGAGQLGFRVFNLLRGQAETQEAHDLFGPIFLMGIGGVAFLASQGAQYRDQLLTLLSLWPVLLIAAGITILFGRRSAIISGLLGVLVVALMLTVMLAGDRLGLKPNPMWFSIGDVGGGGERITGSGTPASKDFQISNVHSVEHAAIGSLEILQGENESLVIEADDNILPYIIANVSGGELTIKLQRGYNFSPRSEVQMVLTVKDLDEIVLSGAGSATVPSLTTDELDLKLSGAGSLKVDELQASKLDVDLSGAGSAAVTGKVIELMVEISGAGSFDGPDLECANAVVEIPGMGNARLWVTTSLETRISGMGSINYYGSPTLRENNTGVGTLHALGEK